MSVFFEFPENELDKQRFIAKHKRLRRQWVSTAVVDGRVRMKFERPKRHKPEVIAYPGKENAGGRAEWDR